jgi:hypothetical protein
MLTAGDYHSVPAHGGPGPTPYAAGPGLPPGPNPSPRRGPVMFPLAPPYCVHASFAGPAAGLPITFPAPWAIRVEDLPSARVAVGCLMDRPVARLELVLGPHGRVYVRWTE